MNKKNLLRAAAANEGWAKTANRTARTAPARARLEEKWLTEAGGDPVAAAHLRKAFYLRLAAKSAEARKLRREVAESAEAAGIDVSEVEDLATGRPQGAERRE